MSTGIMRSSGQIVEVRSVVLLVGCQNVQRCRRESEAHRRVDEARASAMKEVSL